MKIQAQIYEQVNAKLQREKDELEQKLERVMFRLSILEAEKHLKEKKQNTNRKITKDIKKEAKKRLYQSHDYFIKYSAGKPIACYPFHAGGTYYEMGAEKPCNTVQEAKGILRDVALRHAYEIHNNDWWESSTCQS